MAESSGLKLSQRHCELLHQGTKQAVVRARRFDVEGQYVVCSDKAYGVAEFSNPKEITLELFKELQSLHHITDAERAERWPDASALWFYRVKSYEPFDEPKEIVQKADGADFVAGVTPDTVEAHGDADLKAVADRLSDIWDRHFATTDKITSDGLNRESVLNAALFVLAELKNRKLDAPTGSLWEAAREMGKADHAPVNPGSESKGEPIKLNQITGDIKPIQLRHDAVCLVGSVATWGEGNDADMLVKGPLDDATRHVINFRLGRMYPPEISGQLRFVDEDEYLEAARSGTEKLTGRLSFHDDEYGGPFTTHVPLYDLYLVPKTCA